MIDILVILSEKTGPIAKFLSTRDFFVQTTDCNSVKDDIHKMHADIVIADADAYNPIKDLLKIVKDFNRRLPIMLVSSDHDYARCAELLDLGFDDYVRIPTSYEEICCRVNAITSRTSLDTQQRTYKIGDYIYLVHRREVIYCGDKSVAPQHLSSLQSAVLEFLCNNMHRVAPQDELLQACWGKSDIFVTRSMQVLISHLRKVFADDKRIRIHSFRSFGVKLIVDDKAQ